MIHDPMPTAEVIGYTSFNNFLARHAQTVWSKQVWSNVVHELHEKGLVTLPAVSPEDGLNAVGLSSYGCSAPDEGFEKVSSWVANVLRGKHKWMITVSPEWKRLFDKIYRGQLDPKDAQTW